MHPTDHIRTEKTKQKEIKEGAYAPKNHTGFLIGKNDKMKSN